MSKTEQSRDYGEFWQRLGESARFHPANRFRYDWIGSTLTKRAPGAKLLIDFGCGDGALLRKVRRLMPSCRCVGFDIAENILMRNRCKEDGIEYFVCDVVDLRQVFAAGLDRGSADVVIMSEIIEHVADDGGLLRNARALLGDQGLLLLTTQSGPRYRMDREILGHLRHYRASDLKQKILSSGFVILDYSERGFPVLSFQKWLTERFFDLALRSFAGGLKPGLALRVGCSILYWLMRLTPPILGGPQIFVTARAV